ncbi:MAG: hypothetical protein KDD58_14995 [Bdellovibrionales bacterium]|nr:hypothetical protein [Bdellovibrionales bacterium]
MKTISVFLLSLLSLTVFAEDQVYTYDCKGLNFSYWQVQLEVSSDKVVYREFNDWNYSFSQPVVYNYSQVKERGFYAGYYKYDIDWNTVVHDYAQIPQLIVEPALLVGGKLLRKGTMGGFVNFLNEEYSYDGFICEIKS